MKTKVITKGVAIQEYKVGDYFLTASGEIRQIVYGITTFGYAALDVKDGTHYYNMPKIESVISQYDYPDSRIKKVEIVGFDRKTKEVLFMEV